MKTKLFLISVPLLALGCLTIIAARSVPTAQNTPTLAKAYEADFQIGAALGGAVINGLDAISTPLVESQFNAFTGENCMKPDAIQPKEGNFTFGDADKLAAIAEKRGATLVGHTLVWHSQTPAWFFQGPDGQPVTRDLALKRMRDHINALVGRYKGKVKQWDVVNEAISDRDDEWLRPSPWLKAIGEDYLEHAFRFAHAADPNALLIYNDYNIENPAKRERTIKLLKSLMDKGVPVHGVGIQGHWGLGGPSLEVIDSAITDYAKLGLKVMITELDISVLPSRYTGADVNIREAREKALDPYTNGLPEEVAQQQAERYRHIFEILRKHRSTVERVTFWGVHDGHSWKNNFPIRGRTDYALLFDRQGKSKPAYNELIALSKK